MCHFSQSRRVKKPPEKRRCPNERKRSCEVWQLSVRHPSCGNFRAAISHAISHVRVPGPTSFANHRRRCLVGPTRRLGTQDRRDLLACRSFDNRLFFAKVVGPGTQMSSCWAWHPNLSYENQAREPLKGEGSSRSDFPRSTDLVPIKNGKIDHIVFHWVKID